MSARMFAIAASAAAVPHARRLRVGQQRHHHTDRDGRHVRRTARNRQHDQLWVVRHHRRYRLCRRKVAQHRWLQQHPDGQGHMRQRQHRRRGQQGRLRQDRQGDQRRRPEQHRHLQRRRSKGQRHRLEQQDQQGLIPLPRADAKVLDTPRFRDLLRLLAGLSARSVPACACREAPRAGQRLDGHPRHAAEFEVHRLGFGHAPLVEH